MDKSANSNFYYLIMALLFTLAMVMGGVDTYKIFQKKTEAQLAVTDAINRWKQSYKALQGVVTTWNGKFATSADVKDVRAVISLLNLQSVGLSADTDNFVLVSATQVKSKSAGAIELGLSKICLGVTDVSFVVKADNYKALLAGLEKLAARSDIHMGSITIQGDMPKPQAKIGDFCVYLRNE